MIVGRVYKKQVHSIWSKWLEVRYKGLNFGNLLINQISYCCHFDDKYSHTSRKELIIILKGLIRSIFLAKKEIPYKFELPIKNILFFYEEDGRKDYKAQCDYVKNQLVKYSLSDVQILKNKSLRHKFNLRHSIEKFLILTKLYYFTFSTRKQYKYKGTYKTLLFYKKSLIYYDYYIQLNKILKQNSVKLLITFCDVKEYANLLTQVSNNLGIITITQQHAIYFKISDSCYSQPFINYENLISKYLLAWGKNIEIQWKDVGVNMDKIIYSGCNIPSHINCVDKSKEVKVRKKIFGVLLSAEYWKESNIKMLKIAYQISRSESFDFQILFHPTNDVKQYLQALPFLNPSKTFQNIKDLDEFIISKQFLLCHTTSAYLFCLTNLKKCYRFKDDNFIDIGGITGDIFSNVEMLQKLLASGTQISDEYIEKTNAVLKLHYGNRSMNYENAIKQILSKEDIHLGMI